MTIDKHSETWVIVNAHLTKELERAQKAVLVRGLPQDETNYWRGYYSALVKIKALENPATDEFVPHTEY